jgi:predicted nucleotidyltransferase
MLTKTETRVLELFTSRLLDSFTIREVSRTIKKDLKIVHTSIKKLIEDKFLIMEKRGLRLDYKKNIQELAYIENTRKDEFLKKHPLIKMHTSKFIGKSKTKLFTLLIFGSYASGKEKRKSDIDLLAIIPELDESFERQLKAVLSASSEKYHINVISEESFKEMISKRDEMNIINETLNNHILLYGSEAYYALLGERDVR